MGEMGKKEVDKFDNDRDSASVEKLTFDLVFGFAFFFRYLTMGVSSLQMSSIVGIIENSRIRSVIESSS